MADSSGQMFRDRTLRYGRNVMFFSVVILCLHFFGVKLNEVTFLGIATAAGNVWLVLAGLLLWHLIYFVFLAYREFRLWDSAARDEISNRYFSPVKNRIRLLAFFPVAFVRYFRVNINDQVYWTGPLKQGDTFVWMAYQSGRQAEGRPMPIAKVFNYVREFREGFFDFSIPFILGLLGLWFVHWGEIMRAIKAIVGAAAGS